MDGIIGHLERVLLGKSLGVVMWLCDCEGEVCFVGSGAVFMSVHEEGSRSCLLIWSPRD